jgi:hypothetical protein
MAKARSKTQESRAAAYKTEKRWEKNRKRKLQRALKRDPNNAEQINAALGSIVYRRKTPLKPAWTSTSRRIAILSKKFKLTKQNLEDNKKAEKPSYGAMFTISTRLGGVWV